MNLKHHTLTLVIPAFDLDQFQAFRKNSIYGETEGANAMISNKPPSLPTSQCLAWL